MRVLRMTAALVTCALMASAMGAQAAVWEPPIPSSALKQGGEFSGAEVRAMQRDDFENPGMLWVTRGERVWSEAAGASGKSCASCHGNASASMKGVATRYPRVDPAAGLVNLSGRINACRQGNQEAPPLAHESEALLGLTAYVTYHSRGMPMRVIPDERNAAFLERGRARYQRRLGQMNLACAQCHDRNWGRTLLHEKISQGHGTGWPAYRLEWQTFGSLARRLRACYSGLRAEMPEYGASELLELELYLAWRANGLAIEAPGVRR